MGLQPMGKVPDLRRLAGRVASRSTVRWSWLRMVLGFCVFAAVAGGPVVGLPHAPVAAAVAGIPRSAVGPAGLPQTITFDQPQDTTVGQPVTLSAASVTATSPSRPTGLTVSFRSDTPGACAVSGFTVTPATADVCTITASQGGSARYAAAQPVQRSFQAHTGTSQQAITFAQPPDVILGQPATLSAATDASEPWSCCSAQIRPWCAPCRAPQSRPSRSAPVS